MRHNYPYSGISDGLTTSLRKRHTQARYLGVEIEINQALVGAERWRSVQRCSLRPASRELMDGAQ